MSAGTTPAHRRPELVALVVLGGALGTGLRQAVSVAVGPPGQGWPTGTFLVNLLGSFVLGVLLAGIARRGEESPRGTALRLALGTGVLGGFTTYSSLAVEVDQLWGAGALALGLTYAVTTLVGGLVAAVLGLGLGSRVVRPR